MPRDFLSDNDNQMPSNEKLPGRDFLSESPKESLIASAALAFPRIGEDIIKGGYNTIKNIPQYYQSAKVGIPGALDVLKQHPDIAGKQALAGLTEMGHGLLNAPRGLAEYGANRLNLIPQSVAESVPYQKDISGQINQLLGVPQSAGEEAIRWGGRNALNLMGAPKAAITLNPMNLRAKSIAKDILNTAEQNKKSYKKAYNNLWKEAKDQGFHDMSHVVPDIDVNTLRKYSPKKSIAGIEDFIKNPTVQTAHNAKSDLLRIERDLGKLPTLRTAERKQLKAATDAINSIKDNMFKTRYGYSENALLDKYNKIQQGYAQEVIPYKNKYINKFKKNEISAPELINALSHGEFAAKRGSYHPAISLRKKVIPALAGVGTLGIGKTIYDDIMGIHSGD